MAAMAMFRHQDVIAYAQAWHESDGWTVEQVDSKIDELCMTLGDFVNTSKFTTHYARIVGFVSRKRMLLNNDNPRDYAITITAHDRAGRFEHGVALAYVESFKRTEQLTPGTARMERNRQRRSNRRALGPDWRVYARHALATDAGWSYGIALREQSKPADPNKIIVIK